MPEFRSDNEIQFLDPIIFKWNTARRSVYICSVSWFILAMHPYNSVIFIFAFVSIGLAMFAVVYLDFPEMLYEALRGVLFLSTFGITLFSYYMLAVPRWFKKATSIVANTFFQDESYFEEDMGPLIVIFAVIIVGYMTLGMHDYLVNAKKASDYEKKHAIEEKHNVKVLQV